MQYWRLNVKVNLWRQGKVMFRCSSIILKKVIANKRYLNSIVMLLDTGGGLIGPPDLWARWDEVKKGRSDEEVVRQGATRRRGPTAGKESKSICSGGRSANYGRPARNWATWGGVLPTYPTGPGWDTYPPGNWRGEPPWATVWQKLGAVYHTRTSCSFCAFFQICAYIRLTGQLLFSLVYWRVDGPKHFVGCLRPNDLPDHPDS